MSIGRFKVNWATICLPLIKKLVEMTINTGQMYGCSNIHYTFITFIIALIV